MNIRPQSYLHYALKLCVLLIPLLCSLPLHAQQGELEAESKGKSTLETLRNLVSLQANLRHDIASLNKQIAKASSDAEKQALQQELSDRQDDLKATSRNLENISAGVDLSSLRDQEETKFDFQQEVFALLKPAIDEMKDMTARIRQKSDLKEKIVYYSDRLEIVDAALANVNRLQSQAESEKL